jgi:hypothetical protein
MNSDEVYIDGENIHAVSPEGKGATMPLQALFQKLIPSSMDTRGVVLPDGVKAVLSQGHVTIWVAERSPQVYAFKWIANGSHAPYGTGTQYRVVRLSVPYLIVLAVFMAGPNGHFTLSQSNECFFRNGPLTSLDDELFYPALLNCSKFRSQEGAPLSWICTQYLNRAFERETDPNRRARAAFTSLMHCLLETGFNYSSEHHEGASWFGESRRVDPRLETVEAWEAASEQDPLFAADVPWLRTGFTVRQVAERIFKNQKATHPSIAHAATLARIIFNYRNGQ